MGMRNNIISISNPEPLGGELNQLKFKRKIYLISKKTTMNEFTKNLIATVRQNKIVSAAIFTTGLLAGAASSYYFFGLPPITYTLCGKAGFTVCRAGGRSVCTAYGETAIETGLTYDQCKKKET